MRASFAGCVDVVNELILAKADVNRRDTVRDTWIPKFCVYCSEIPTLDAGHWHDCSVCTGSLLIIAQSSLNWVVTQWISLWLRFT